MFTWCEDRMCLHSLTHSASRTWSLFGFGRLVLWRSGDGSGYLTEKSDRSFKGRRKNQFILTILKFLSKKVCTSAWVIPNQAVGTSGEAALDDPYREMTPAGPAEWWVSAGARIRAAVCAHLGAGSEEVNFSWRMRSFENRQSINPIEKQKKISF